MKQAFIIMQIGNKELDEICKKAIVPTLISCGFDPKRVDKHNMGGLLKSEIINFILTSDIIIADLTNERQNCYLEVGYAMGANKFRNLILTAREDHNPDSSNYKKGGPKIHFDLAGYDILYWDPNNLECFKDNLEKRVNRRIMSLPLLRSESNWDLEWIEKQRDIALSGLKRNNLSGYMEIKFCLQDYRLNSDLADLLDSAEHAQIKTFGWPIGAMDKCREDFRPKPTTEGIVTELELSDGGSYDYWMIRKDGAFYLLKSLCEDKRTPGYIFPNTRIVRITETLLYVVRLYSGLKVPINSCIILGIRHGGLKDRILSTSGERAITIFDQYKCFSNDEVYNEVEIELEKIESNLIDLVERFTRPLFEVFDYFKLNKSVLEDIVDNFVKGRVT